MTKRSPFRYFKSSPEIIRLAVMLYIRFPLSLRNVEDLLHEWGWPAAGFVDRQVGPHRSGRLLGNSPGAGHQDTAGRGLGRGECEGACGTTIRDRMSNQDSYSC